MTVSPAQRAQRRAAGKKSGKSRARHGEEARPQTVDDVTLPKTGNAAIDSQMADFIKLCGMPQGWPDVKNFFQSQVEAYKALSAAEAYRQETGATLTRDQVRQRDERAAQVFRTELQTINQQLTALVPADRLLAAQSAMREWIDGVLNRVADAIEGEK